MKKILLIAFISIMALGASAQLASPISIGVHGGWASTKINTKGTTFADVKSSASGGYMLGVFGRINLGKLYIQPEFNYSRKTGSVEFPGQNLVTKEIANIASDLTYSSIDIPILLGFKIIKLPMLNIHIFAGPVASFSTSALSIDFNDVKKAVEYGVDTENFKKELDPEKAIWNVKMGAGIEVWKFNLDFDYEMGLKDFSKHIKAPQIFNITLGLRLI